MNYKFDTNLDGSVLSKQDTIGKKCEEIKDTIRRKATES